MKNTQGVSQKFRVTAHPVFELTLPPLLQKKVRAGDFFRVERGERALVLRPSSAVAPEDAWFFTKEWQKKEREADADVRKGKMHGPYKTVTAMFRDFGIKA